MSDLGPRPYLSYTPADRDMVWELSGALRRRGLDPWMDIAEMRPGSPVTDEIERGIADSTSVVVLLTATPPSEYQRLEWQRAAARKLPIFSVILDDIAEVPEPLRSFYPLTFVTGDLESLADTLYERSGIALELGPPPAGLVDALTRQDVVAFVGAGLASAAGYPVWSELVAGLLDWAQDRHRLDEELLRALRSTLRAGERNSVADAVVGAVDRHDLAAYMREVFAERAVLPENYELLASLRLSALVTTNYDGLLKRAVPDVPLLTLPFAESVLDHLSHRNPFLLHVYGALDDVDSLVFSPAQLDELLDTDMKAAQALEAVFSTRTMLFLGASLSGISDFLQALSIRSRSGTSHYAVVYVDTPGWRAQADQLSRRYNVQVLPYSDRSHRQVTAFLSALSGGLSRWPRDVADERSEKLARITLENIGPYHHLLLDLDPGWNVLLGDNGVGKSTILKAIALVYAGEEALGYADRLLRTGTSRGSIRIETRSGRSFHTELLRSTSGVTVRHSPGVTLEAEGQVVMGLPPLRALTWRRESSPSGSETPKRPTPSDLLPLLAGETDPRLDSVKQRIVNCDYRIKDAISKGEDSTSAQRLLDDLVAGIQLLTDALAVKFRGVDVVTNAVMVDTVDGPLPIEALSQGTGALIGWVSLIIQRLHDTAGPDEVPLERGAIVLIDEMDAHLHPDWQQQLPHRLCELLPGVQFIGTTHSPLIVGGMKYRQVTVMRREDGQVCKVPLQGAPNDTIRGRADQLLTGRLFGLATSVDVDTRHDVERYNDLLGKDRTPDEETEFYELQDLLEVRIPVDATTPAERRAQDLVDLLLRESLGNDLPEARNRLLEQAGKLLEEAAQMRPLSD